MFYFIYMKFRRHLPPPTQMRLPSIYSREATELLGELPYLTLKTAEQHTWILCAVPNHTVKDCRFMEIRQGDERRKETMPEIWVGGALIFPDGEICPDGDLSLTEGHTTVSQENGTGLALPLGPGLISYFHFLGKLFKFSKMSKIRMMIMNISFSHED